MVASTKNRIDASFDLRDNVKDVRLAVIDDELAVKNDRLAVNNNRLAAEIGNRTDMDNRSDTQAGN